MCAIVSPRVFESRLCLFLGCFLISLVICSLLSADVIFYLIFLVLVNVYVQRVA
jgi:hypothetical protein